MSQLTHVLGRAHAIDVLRVLGADSQGMTFNTIRRLSKTDSRTTAALLREFVKLGIADHQESAYRLSVRGTKVLSGLARLHADSEFPW